MKVVAFNGSARPRGNCAIMIREVFKPLERQGIKTELVQLSELTIEPCRACYQCAENRDQRCALGDDDLNHCIARMQAADGVILASPTYIGDVSSAMKALLDRAGLVSRVNGNLFRRKVGAALTAASWGGAIHAFETMNNFFLIGEMIVVGSGNWNLAFGREPGEVAGDAKAMQNLATLGENLAWLLSRL